ncbi:uncharacterized protein LOC130827823 [Amaranthus tricolor]|uniref:uncharacterized protein LOC130827823 n=1 Tax=Amaranthus tricolor TaxID=29722 RepID=UPI00258522EA|nr:uncharacterized protein LOC130827823 [Amaranthus tricolor]
MDIRVGLVLLFIAGNLVCDAIKDVSLEVSGTENSGGFIDVCTLCEDYTTMALRYLSENKTQNEIMDSLHKACFELHGLADQCTMLVNYYAPLFFLEVSSVQPEGFCKKIGLCRNALMFSRPEKTTPCDLCHKAMDEALEKLKDPDTELEVIQVLLKACDAVGNYVRKCKSLVFEFGPIILVDATKFIENIDLCSTFHACRKQNIGTQELVDGRIKMVTSS